MDSINRLKMPEKNLLTAKQAANYAIKYLRESIRRTPPGLAVEELTLTKSGKYGKVWKVILSYYENIFIANKTMKKVLVDAKTGELLSITKA